MLHESHGMVAKRFVAKRNGKHDEETTGVHVCHQLISPQQRFVAKQNSRQHDEETMGTSVAQDLPTPTPAKRLSTNKHPSKQARDILLALSPDDTTWSIKVTAALTHAFCSQYLVDYKTKDLVEFKHLFKRKKQAIKTYSRISTLYLQNSVAPSLKN